MTTQHELLAAARVAPAVAGLSTAAAEGARIYFEAYEKVAAERAKESCFTIRLLASCEPTVEELSSKEQQHGKSVAYSALKRLARSLGLEEA